MPAPVPFPDPDQARHSPVEDLQGLGLGVFLCALGLNFLTYAGLLTGQMAGLAVMISYLTGWGFGTVFFVLNLPFYWLGYTRFGTRFVVKSFVSVTLMSILAELLPLGFVIESLHPALAAIVFGALAGLGLLAVFRHGGSLGGLGVVALVFQDRFGVQAGYIQLGFDALLFMIACTLFPIPIVGWSLLGAVVLNLIIAINHRKDRYIGT